MPMLRLVFCLLICGLCPAGSAQVDAFFHLYSNFDYHLEHFDLQGDVHTMHWHSDDNSTTEYDYTFAPSGALLEYRSILNPANRIDRSLYQYENGQLIKQRGDIFVDNEWRSPSNWCEFSYNEKGLAAVTFGNSKLLSQYDDDGNLVMLYPDPSSKGGGAIYRYRYRDGVRVETIVETWLENQLIFTVGLSYNQAGLVTTIRNLQGADSSGEDLIHHFIYDEHNHLQIMELDAINKDLEVRHLHHLILQEETRDAQGNWTMRRWLDEISGEEQVFSRAISYYPKDSLDTLK